MAAKYGFVQKGDNQFGDWYPITPSDTLTVPLAAGITTLPTNDIGCKGIYVGGAGDVTVKSRNGNLATFTAVPVGTTLDVMPEYVMATDTTATLMVALL